jgi:paraquat-inducible protein A
MGFEPSRQVGTGLIACHECDLLQRDPFHQQSSDLPSGKSSRAAEVCCARCGARIYSVPKASLDSALALALAACIVFVIANAFPLAIIDAQGHENGSTLLGAVCLLWQQDMKLIAGLVCLTTVIVPALELLVFSSLLLLLRLGHPLQTMRRLPRALRVVLHARPWSMIEVFMLGVLVSLVKLAHLASLTLGVALWAYGALMLLLAALSATVDIRKIWAGLPLRHVPPVAPAIDVPAVQIEPTAAAFGWVSCHVCGLLSPRPQEGRHADCPRCAAALHGRIPGSLTSAWALLLAAAILFLPANLLPIMETGSLFGVQRDTILSGVVFLWSSGSWPLAVLVFVASIVVPLFKLLAMSLLLLSVQQGWSRYRHARTRLYRLLELVGRWSMLDIYVVTILSALVQIRTLATITVGPGALAFGAVVVMTMLATLRFDPRLIWDAGVSETELNHA